MMSSGVHQIKEFPCFKVDRMFGFKVLVTRDKGYQNSNSLVLYLLTFIEIRFSAITYGQQASEIEHLV